LASIDYVTTKLSEVCSKSKKGISNRLFEIEYRLGCHANSVENVLSRKSADAAADAAAAAAAYVAAYVKDIKLLMEKAKEGV